MMIDIGQSQSSSIFNDSMIINRRNDDQQRNLDQQIIKSIPKLNLASFGIEIGGKKVNDDNDRIKTAKIDDSNVYKTNERNRFGNVDDDDNIRRRNRERIENFRNSLREIEWEYLDRRQTSTRRPLSSTTTTTTTTYRPRPTSKSPNEYPIRDCRQECVPQHYLQHYYIKNCRSIFSRDCNCAKRFNCPDDGNHFSFFIFNNF